MEGMAAYIYSPGYNPTAIAKAAEEVEFTGIGIYSNFVHVDVKLNEKVKVSLQSLQLYIDEIEESEKLKKLYPKKGQLSINKNTDESSYLENSKLPYVHKWYI